MRGADEGDGDVWLPVAMEGKFRRGREGQWGSGALKVDVCMYGRRTGPSKEIIRVIQ